VFGKKRLIKQIVPDTVQNVHAHTHLSQHMIIVFLLIKTIISTCGGATSNFCSSDMCFADRCFRDTKISVF